MSREFLVVALILSILFILSNVIFVVRASDVLVRNSTASASQDGRIGRGGNFAPLVNAATDQPGLQGPGCRTAAPASQSAR